jgi:WD40 repeat protein
MYLIGILFNRIDIWDYFSAKHVATLRSNHHYFPNIYNCSSDGSLLAICSGDGAKLTIWDLTIMDACRELHQLTPPHCASISSICFVTHSDHLVVSYGNYIALYNAKDGTVLHLNEMPFCAVVFSRGARDSIVALSLHGDVQEFDADLTFRRSYRIQLDESCYSVILSGDSLVWSSDERLKFLNLATLVSFAKFNIFSNVRALRDNNDGSRMLVVLSDPLKILALDVVNECCLFEFTSYGGVCYSSDGTCIYGVSSVGDLFCLDAETGSPLSCPFLLPEAVPYCFEALAILSPAQVILM